MAPGNGMIRYNTDNQYYERSIDEGSIWGELSLIGMTKGPGAVEQIITVTGNQPAITLNSMVTRLKCNNSALLTIQGLVPHIGQGDILFISSFNAQVDLEHLSGSASAGNKIQNFATVGKTSLAAGVGNAIYVYQGGAGSGQWILITHEQGAWITPTYASGDYTAAGGGSWTVGSGDVTNYSYYLDGRNLKVNYKWDTTSMASTPTSVSAKIPGGYTSTKALDWYSVCNNNGTFHPGLSRVTASGTTMTFFSNEGGSGWGNSTDNSEVGGSISFEVN